MSFVVSVLSMNCQPLFLSFDNAKVLTFSKYPNFFHKNLQTFLHFVCKCLKISTLKKQKFSYLQNDKNGQKDGQKGDFRDGAQCGFVWLRNSPYLRSKYRTIYLPILIAKTAENRLILGRAIFAPTGPG